MAANIHTESWTRGLDLPSRLFETGSDDYELYEEDDEFVLNVELPGFDVEDIDVSWDDGMLNIAAEREDEQRGDVGPTTDASGSRKTWMTRVSPRRTTTVSCR